ncbi:MAG: nucleotide-binding protein [Candidatus Poribacteria bacterium]|nr:nucleotide-binding protein [Candidatus Poribacteria bacterium]
MATYINGRSEQALILEELKKLNNKQVSDSSARSFGNKIFIVHGHDEAAKHKIARFIENLDLTATILDEQPSKGQTIIDKFEEHADEAGFAIVLLTADDVGAPKDRTDALKPRARQNVILELGYFLSGLGRDRVRILYEEGVELPSDIHGIIYVQMDERGAWKLELAQEMASVGITVDMNKLLPNR